MIDRLRFASLNVPRYTSYPTAPHFSAAVKDARMRQWLGELAPDNRLSLYFHVPFCVSMCHYCGCTTRVVKKTAPIDVYTEHLLDEIDLVAAASGAHRVTDIHWGGGTPSMLGPENFAHIWQRLNERFDLSGLAHHAIELDPRTLTPEFAAAMAAAGVNRASFGIQDFNEDVQKAIGRIQPFEVVACAFDLLRAVGITKINADLIYGLPHQTLTHLAENIRQTVRLNPDRVSVFGYAHVPWMKKHQRLIDESTLPDTATRLDQAEAVSRMLVEAGYAAIGMDHFARPDDNLCAAAGTGSLHRNFQGYTTDAADAIIGFGASAISTLPQGYAQNEPSTGLYQKRIGEGLFATCRGHAFSEDDKIRSALIERLMCNFAVDVGEIAPSSNLAGAFDRLGALAEEGLVRVEGSRVEMTPEGRPFVRIAAHAFDAYASPEARYSRAV